jgi:NDP-sugar pyrophosphorylase family protein
MPHAAPAGQARAFPTPVQQALIFAAGEGTRLRPLTLDRPKPMLPVGDQPLLERLVVLLRQHGIREITINLHYRGDIIQRHFADGARWGVRIHYLHEPRLLGSAGTLLQLRQHFTGSFVALYGDLYTNADLSALAAYHAAHHARLTLAVHTAEEPTREGIVALAPEPDGAPDAGRVTRFVEKPPPDAVFSRLANAGIFFMEPDVTDALTPPPGARDPQATPLDIGHDLLPALLASGAPVYATPLRGFLLDIGSPERYREANDHARLVPAGAAPQ